MYGEISALGAFCTHYNARLENGILSDDTIVCPSHHACFCAKSGDLKEPPALNARRNLKSRSTEKTL